MSNRTPVLVKAAGRTLALGAIVGGEGSAPNVAMRRIADATTQFLDVANDIRQSLAGPAQKGTLIAEKSGPLLKSINEASQSILAHYSSVRLRMQAPVFSDWSKSVPAYHEASVSMTLAERYHSATHAEKRTMLANIVSDPAEHIDMIRALATVPRAITGITKAQSAALSGLAFKATRPAECEALQVEQEQLHIATGAVRMALDITRDAGADLSAMPTLAPAAGELLAAEHLRWADPRSLLTEA